MAIGSCPQCGASRDPDQVACRTCGYSFLSSGQIVDVADDTASVKASRGRPQVMLLAVVVLAVVAGGISITWLNSADLAPRQSVSGTYLLIGSSPNSISVSGSGCSGSGGYSDIQTGTNVMLRDGDGKILATSSLGGGSKGTGTCSFSFRFADVPEVSFYTVEVGRRGQLSYSLADLRSKDWTLLLTLGA